MNLPNSLTILRVILIPFFVIFMKSDLGGAGKYIALAIYIIASLTDSLDGYLARKNHQVTNFGKFMDPLADKLLVTAALISLVELQVVPAWATVIIISREFAVSGLRTIAASEGKVIAASMWGKVKTVTQIAAIIALLLQVNVGTSKYLISLVESSEIIKQFIKYGPRFILFIAVLMTIISGYDYFKKNIKIINSNK